MEEKKPFEHLEHVKMDGVPNIVRSRHMCARLLWSVLLVANASVCVWLIVGTVAEYVEHKVSTSIRVHKEKRTPLPTITICNLNPFSSTFAAQLWRSAGVTPEPDANAFSYLMQMQYYMHTVHGTYLNSSELQRLSSLSDMLYSCDLGDTKCNASDFTYIFHPNFFNCYRFNTHGEHKAVGAGQMSRLRVRLYAGLPHPINESYVRGFYILIQNATDYPYSDSPSLFELMPGLGATFVPSRTFIKLHEAPYSECTVCDLVQQLALFNSNNNKMYFNF